MSDRPSPLKPASPVRNTARRAAQAGVNIIWLVPIIALLVTLAVAWNNFAGRGTLIEVAFRDATGITPGETALKFREVTVGEVEAVRFSEDLTKILAEIRVDREVAKYIDDDAAFWLVRPQVSAQGVTRLDTVLTGGFIEGYWDATIGEQQTHFTGLDRAPLTREDAQGQRVTLTTDNAEGITEGAPVMYRGLKVGRLENLRISDDGGAVLVDAFIQAPHDERLTSNTVFWDTSGVSVGLGAAGVSVDVNSLASLLQGGVQFATFSSGGEPVQRGHVFTLNPDQDTARKSIFSADARDLARFTLLLDEAVSGLEQGADVRFQGLTVGRVTDLAARALPDGQSQQQINIALSPVRLGLPEGATPGDATIFLSDAVTAGLRARVTSAGFLGTSLIVELVELPDAAPATLDLTGDPLPILPTATSKITDFADSAQGVISRIGQLPIEDTLKSAMDMMNSVTALASSQDTRAIPESLRRTIDNAGETMADLRDMVGTLDEAGTMTNIGKLVDEATATFESLKVAAEDAPALIASIDAAAKSVDEIAFAEISAQAEAVLSDLHTVLGSEEAARLAANIDGMIEEGSTLLAELRAMSAQLNQSGAVSDLTRLIDEAAATFESLKLAAEGAPEMIENIDAAAIAVDEFAFDEISAEAEAILADLRALLGTEDAAQLPRNLSDTLQAASGLLNDLRDGNAAGSLNNALNSASVAADEIAKAVQDLPTLTRRLQQTAARAESVLAAYGDRSAFNNEAINMMRELRRATDAFGSLARMIERNPRAFILGR